MQKTVKEQEIKLTQERIAGNSFGELLFHFSNRLFTEGGNSDIMPVASDPSFVLWPEPMQTTLLQASSAAGVTEHWFSSDEESWLSKQDLKHNNNTAHSYTVTPC